MLFTTMPLKIKNCHDAHFGITDGTARCHNITIITTQEFLAAMTYQISILSKDVYQPTCCEPLYSIHLLNGRLQLTELSWHQRTHYANRNGMTAAGWKWRQMIRQTWYTGPKWKYTVTKCKCGMLKYKKFRNILSLNVNMVCSKQEIQVKCFTKI